MVSAILGLDVCCSIAFCLCFYLSQMVEKVKLKNCLVTSRPVLSQDGGVTCHALSCDILGLE